MIGQDIEIATDHCAVLERFIFQEFEDVEPDFVWHVDRRCGIFGSSWFRGGWIGGSWFRGSRRHRSGGFGLHVVAFERQEAAKCKGGRVDERSILQSLKLGDVRGKEGRGREGKSGGRGNNNHNVRFGQQRPFDSAKQRNQYISGGISFHSIRDYLCLTG